MVARYLGVVEAVGSSPVTPTSRKVRKHAVYGLFSLPANCVCPLPVHYCPEDAFCPQLVLISRIFLSLPSGSGGGVSFLEKSRTFAIASRLDGSNVSCIVGEDDELLGDHSFTKELLGNARFRSIPGGKHSGYTLPLKDFFARMLHYYEEVIPLKEGAEFCFKKTFPPLFCITKRISKPAHHSSLHGFRRLTAHDEFFCTNFFTYALICGIIEMIYHYLSAGDI